MFCANCGNTTSEGSELCANCRPHLPPTDVAQVVPEAARVAAGGTATADNPQPGWYLDPSAADQQRYWDGVAWTAWTEATQRASSTWSPQARHTIAGMSFPDAVKTVLTKYVNFTGRARRCEYWWYALFIGIVYTVVFVGAIAVAVATVQSRPGATAGQTYIASGSSMNLASLVVNVLFLAVFLPTLGVSVRRLHDTNRSGWYYLFSFIPLAGGIILAIFMCEDSNRGPNQYGPSPKYV